MTATTRVRPFQLLLLALAAACLASGCGQDESNDGTAGDGAGIASLPSPEGGGGSVTGMPGARADARPGTPASDTATDPFDLAGVEGNGFDENGNPLPAGDAIASMPGEAGGEPGALGELPPTGDGAAMAPGEPTAGDAAAVVRRYYGAIDARQYEQAYQLWAGGGGASGQSAASFADGFAGTAGVTVQTGMPGQVEGAAGSRYVRVPVAIRAVHVDGSEHTYEGSYTLRRAVVEGATAEQREWRIDSADLHQVQR